MSNLEELAKQKAQAQADRKSASRKKSDAVQDEDTFLSLNNSKMVEAPLQIRGIKTEE